MTALPQTVADHDAWVQGFRPLDNRSVSLVTTPQVSSASSQHVDVLIDGLLFDTDALAARLSLSPSPSDPAALVLRAYESLGEGWLSALSGHFAILVHDRRRERFVALRDRMGQHPLFHTAAAGTQLFSSSIDALLAQAGVSRDLNRVALAEHLAHRWPEITETYYAHVFRIPPGHLLEIDRGRQRLRRYWDVGSEPPLNLKDDEAVDAFDRALERAVGRGTARGRAAIFLSGGLDSISLVAVAADRAARTGEALPHALSLGFPDPECDEEFVQRGAAEALGCEQDFVPFSRAIGARGLLVAATGLSASLPAPLLNIWQPAFATLGRTARERGRSVILTGTGGDEWLSVTPYLAADFMRQGRLGELAWFTGVLQRSYRMSAVEAAYGAWWRFGARPLAAMLADRIAPQTFQRRRRKKLVAGTPSWLTPDPQLRAQLDDRAERMLAPSKPSGSFYDREMRTALDHTLMSIEHEESFEFGRRLGVSFMHPYCDADLVELLYRMPPTLLCRGGRSKGLVRETIARRFPALGFEAQRKVNATGFYSEILRREGAQAWELVEHGKALAALGVVDPVRLTDTMNGLFSGREARERYRIWSVLNLAAWVGGRSRPSTTGRNER